MKYRKKAIVIEAYQTKEEKIIHTLEGDMKASVGDYIITGVNGEQYPCKPDIFEKTYETVESEEEPVSKDFVEEVEKHTYIGTKVVKAYPCLAWKDAGDHKAGDEGYKVIYEDGYKSWSPKYVFEKHYKKSDTYIDRMKIELEELQDRLMKLNGFLESEKSKNLISFNERFLMENQAAYMKRYICCLVSRIDYAETKK